MVDVAEDGNGMDVDRESNEQEQLPTNREVFSCRTVHRERGSTMEYMLSFGCNDERDADEEASPYLNYQLVSTQNIVGLSGGPKAHISVATMLKKQQQKIEVYE